MTGPGIGVRALLAAGAVLAIVAGGACSSNTGQPSQGGRPADGDAGVVHVHGLGINPKDGALYAATHTGLFRIPESGVAERIADRHQDTMGFTVAGPDRFLGSGHPDMRDYRAGRLPALLGLVESSDAGATWQSRSLSGKADFHALRAAHGRIYGFDSTSGAFMVSDDGMTWETRATVPIRDFAVSPSDPDLVVATSQRGTLRSRDGGRSWAVLTAPPLVLLDWATQDTLWAAAADGVIFRSADGGDSWVQRGALGGPPEALLAAAGTLYAAVHEQGIFRSDDGGVTWRLHYRDPAVAPDSGGAPAKPGAPQRFAG